MLKLNLKYILLCSLFVLPFTSAVAQAYPECSFDEYERDTHPQWGDSDLWGWENGASCTYTIPFSGPSSPTTPTTPPATTPATTQATGSTGTPVCTQAGSDSDGDGWGWENGASCVVGSTTTPATPTSGGLVCTDTPPFNDDWGWDETNFISCRLSDPAYQGSGGPDTGVTTFDDVTHVVLMAGQSNAVNSYESFVDASGSSPNKTPRGADAVDSNIIVWLPGSGQWQPANLCTQSWSTESSYYPARGGLCANKTIFHIAKRLRSARGGKIAIISTGLHGQSITQWDSDNSRGMNEIKNAVSGALAGFSNKRVDLIAWAQGEADVGRNSYGSDLSQLVTRFRNLQINGNRYLQNSYFVAQEISKEIDKAKPVTPSCSEKTGSFVSASDFNSIIRSAMNNDGDSSTNWIAAESEATVGCGNVHFNASSMRTLGSRFANRYLAISGR